MDAARAAARSARPPRAPSAPARRLSATVIRANTRRPSGTWTTPAATTRCGVEPVERAAAEADGAAGGRAAAGRRGCGEMARSSVDLPAPLPPRTVDDARRRARRATPDAGRARARNRPTAPVRRDRRRPEMPLIPSGATRRLWLHRPWGTPLSDSSGVGSPQHRGGRPSTGRGRLAETWPVTSGAPPCARAQHSVGPPAGARRWHPPRHGTPQRRTEHEWKVLAECLRGADGAGAGAGRTSISRNSGRIHSLRPGLPYDQHWQEAEEAMRYGIETISAPRGSPRRDLSTRRRWAGGAPSRGCRWNCWCTRTGMRAIWSGTRCWRSRAVKGPERLPC